MSWVRLVNGRLTYTGRLAPPASFEAWCAGDGKPLVDALAARRRFALFGAARAARRELWSALRENAERGALAEGIVLAADAYLPTIAEVASLPVELPRVVASLRRIVVVPRVVCTATLLDYIAAAFERIEGQIDEALREYLAMELLAAIDNAVLAAATVGRSGVPAAQGWAIVDADRDFSWWVPPSGDSARRWRGHYVLYEVPNGKLTRAVRKDVSGRIADLYERLPGLTQHQRNEIVTRARMAMRDVTARALRRAAI